jgi:hypothetical protein
MLAARDPNPGETPLAAAQGMGHAATRTESDDKGVLHHNGSDAAGPAPRGATDLELLTSNHFQQKKSNPFAWPWEKETTGTPT